MNYSFWEKEINTITSLVKGIAPDSTLCITGVPSYERKNVIEQILKENEIEYLLYPCRSQMTLRTILYDICKYLAKLLGTTTVIKSQGELMMDLREFSDLYFERQDKKKSFYVVFDTCENLDDSVVSLLCNLSCKISSIGIIMLSISIDPYKQNNAFIIHLPVLTRQEMENALMDEINPSKDDSLKKLVVQSVIRFYSSQTHSLSELKTLCDITLSHCMETKISTQQEIEKYLVSLQPSLFVNIMPITADHVNASAHRTVHIPLSDFCGVDISLNAKLLLIASYFCSIYEEKYDCKLFGIDERLEIKTKGGKRRRRKTASAIKSNKSNTFSIHRLIALYQNLKQIIFPELKASSSNYGFILSQISVLTRLGLLSQVGVGVNTIDLNQLVYRCQIKKINVLNIAKNIHFDITPFVYDCLLNIKVPAIFEFYEILYEHRTDVEEQTYRLAKNSRNRVDIRPRNAPENVVFHKSYIFKMPYPKTHKAEKITTDNLTEDTLNVVSEMLDIIVNRTHIENPDQNFKLPGGHLRYFGVGDQLKISKLADTLYSTMKDVIVFVMEEMAKDSDTDFKFQMPKHTSFVGAIIKSVSIDVIAHNDTYKGYLLDLTTAQGKYPFDANSETFKELYNDVVRKLYERDFLFPDDPEYLAVSHQIREVPDMELPIPQTTSIHSMAISNEEIVQAISQGAYSAIPGKIETIVPKGEEDEDDEILPDLDCFRNSTRNRIIFPYLRRLFETKKSATVTMKRVNEVSSVVEPDDEIKQAFNEHYNEVMKMSQEQLASPEVVKGHCVFSALTYLKERFPKERVDVMEQYLKSEQSGSAKPRKRYVKVPSGKRPRYAEGFPSEFPTPMAPDMHESMMPMM